MANESMEMEGVVTAHSRDVFTVNIKHGDKEHVVSCHVSGKLRKHQIRISDGDRVKIEVSPYDFGKGRITYRL